MAAGGARLLEGGPIADEIRTAVAEDVAPCGNAVSKRAWRVELDGDQLTDRVVAQVELSR